MVTAAKIAPMSERYERPAWVRRINAMADSLGGAIEGAKQLLPIDADELLEAATQSLGGGSFGDFGDSAWQKRFGLLRKNAEGAPPLCCRCVTISSVAFWKKSPILA